MGSTKTLGALALVLVAAGIGAASALSHTATLSQACNGTAVRYGATPIGLPHVDVRGATGHLFYYAGPTLMDRRVNGSDGLVIYSRGTSGTPAMKILWTLSKRAGAILRITGRRLDGDGSFVERWRRAGRNEFPSIVNVPSTGCWRLTLRSGEVDARVVLLAVEPPANPECDATPVYRRTPPHPRFGAITWMPATPRSAGVAAVSFVTTFPDADEAVIPPGGHFPGGPNTKFLWWAPHPGSSLSITGRRLDAPGRFRGAFSSATGDVGAHGGETIFPSIIDVPTTGCWGLTLRTGRSSGLVVFRVMQPS